MLAGVTFGPVRRDSPPRAAEWLRPANSFHISAGFELAAVGIGTLMRGGVLGHYHKPPRGRGAAEPSQRREALGSGFTTPLV